LHALCVGEAPVLLKRQRAVEQCAHVGGEIRPKRRHRRDGLDHRLKERLVRGRRIVEARAGQHRVERGADRPNIGARVDPIDVAAGLFARHVPR